MSIHHKPRPPVELQILENLNVRMNLSTDDQLTYKNLKKGYLGELKFARMLEKTLSKPPLLLYDLSLQLNNSKFQIDCLPIFNNKILLLEIKNFEGDFYFHNDNWHVVETRKEIRSPLMQLKRSELLLKELIQKLGYKIQIESYVIFVNQEFTLYQAPINSSIILPTQVNRFIKKLNNQPAIPDRHQTKLSKQLTDLHLPDSTHTNVPEYSYENLRKGIVCRYCSTYISLSNNTNILCKVCDRKEKIRAAILRSIVEFKLLFPDRKITTSIIYDWCGGIVSKKVVRKTLQDNLRPSGKGRNVHYVFTAKPPPKSLFSWEKDFN